MAIVIAVGVSVMFMYYMMRRHNMIHHSKKCGCKKANSNGTITPIKDEPIKGEPVVSPTGTGIITVGDVLDSAVGNN